MKTCGIDFHITSDNFMEYIVFKLKITDALFKDLDCDLILISLDLATIF